MSLLLPAKKFYAHSLKTNPTFTQAVITGISCYCGDLIAQKLTPFIIYKYHQYTTKGFDPLKNPYVAQPINYARAFRFSMTGLLYLGPFISRWLRYIDHKIPPGSKMAVSKKMVLDQVFISPVLVFGFIAVNSFFEMKMQDFLKYGTNLMEHRKDLDLSGLVGEFLELKGKTLRQTKKFLKTNPLPLIKSYHIACEEFFPIMMTRYPFWITMQFLNFRFAPISWRFIINRITALIWHIYLSWYSNRMMQKDRNKPVHDKK